MGRHNHMPLIEPRILVLEGLWPDTSDALRAAGANVTEGSPWFLEETRAALESGEFHGLVLTGGSDINPRLYTDEPINSNVYGVDNTRDDVEWTALEIALELGIPVLGICRGSQMMTAFRGGRLTQHIDGHRSGEHMTYCEPNARTFRRAIAGRELNVVSLHHQCVLDAGPGMRIAARAFDGTPEAVESLDGKWLGCQFHPEVNAFDNSHSYAIFCWLVDQAAAFAGGRADHMPFGWHGTCATSSRRTSTTTSTARAGAAMATAATLVAALTSTGTTAWHGAMTSTKTLSVPRKRHRKSTRAKQGTRHYRRCAPSRARTRIY